MPLFSEKKEPEEGKGIQGKKTLEEGDERDDEI